MNELTKLQAASLYTLGYLWAKEGKSKMVKVLAESLKQSGINSSYIEYIIAPEPVTVNSDINCNQ